jgi:hypothetical protein
MPVIAALLSGGLSLGIDGRKILLPCIVYGSVHWTRGKFLNVQQKGLIERRPLRKVKPQRHLFVGEREGHAVVIGGHQFIRLVCQDGECGPLVALVFRSFSANQRRPKRHSMGSVVTSCGVIGPSRAAFPSPDTRPPVSKEPTS